MKTEENVRAAASELGPLHRQAGGNAGKPSGKEHVAKARRGGGAMSVPTGTVSRAAPDVPMPLLHGTSH